MAGERKPKWQKQVESILRRHYRGEALDEAIEIAKELAELTSSVEVPAGEAGQVVGRMLKVVSQELRPLAAVYAGFQLGIAFERLQNAKRA